MNTYNTLKNQKAQLEKIIKQEPINDEQRQAIEKAKELLKHINNILEISNV